MKRKLLLAAALAFSVSGAANAQITTFFGDDAPRGAFPNSFAARNAFLASLTASATDDIESIPPFTPGPVLNFAGVGRTATTTAEFAAFKPPLAVSGNQLLLGNLGGDFNNPIANQADVFTLNGPVNGFGMFFIEVGDVSNATTLSFTLENTFLGTSHNVNIGTFGPGRQGTDTFFFGAIDATPFNRVTLNKSTAASGIDGMLYDDVSVGFSAVPEPATLSLLAAGALGAQAMWLRKRRQARRS